MKMNFVFALVVMSVTICSSKELPSFIHVCHDNDPDVNNCMMASIEDLRPYLVKGVPEHNIPRLEPLVLEDLIEEEIAGMHIVVSNASTFGASDFFVRHINVDWDQKSMELHIDLPKLRIHAHYEVDGKVLMINIKGRGEMEANITDCTSQTKFFMEKYEVNGEHLLKFSNIDLNVQIGGGQVRLENLFNGDKVLLGIINDVVNKNLHMFLKELMPSLQKGLARKFLDIGNSVVEPFTCEQLFPH